MKYKDFTSLQGGEVVKITDSPFTDYHGLVLSITNLEKERLIVEVVLFGKKTSVELDRLQVVKVKPRLCFCCNKVFKVDKTNYESYEIGKYLARCPKCAEKDKGRFIATGKEREKALKRKLA